MSKNRIYALRGGNGKITSNIDDILKTAEEFYAKLDAYDLESEANLEIIDVGQVPRVTRDEVASVLKAMKQGKAAGGGGTTANILMCLGGERGREITLLG